MSRAIAALFSIATRRGQAVYQESHGDRDSLRIDISKDKVPAALRRVAGCKYFFVDSPEYIDIKPAMKLVDDALGAKRAGAVT